MPSDRKKDCYNALTLSLDTEKSLFLLKERYFVYIIHDKDILHWKLNAVKIVLRGSIKVVVRKF